MFDYGLLNVNYSISILAFNVKQLGFRKILRFRFKGLFYVMLLNVEDVSVEFNCNY